MSSRNARRYTAYITRNGRDSDRCVRCANAKAAWSSSHGIEQPRYVARLVLAVGVHGDHHVVVVDAIDEQAQRVHDRPLMSEVERGDDHLDVGEVVHLADIGIGPCRVVDHHEGEFDAGVRTGGECFVANPEERLGVVEHRADDPATTVHRPTSATATTDVPAGQIRRIRLVVELTA